jgi:hypothetical protein
VAVSRTSLEGGKPSPPCHIDMSREPHDSATLSRAAHLPPAAHDSGDAAPNTTHEADDNTNSKVERPWTLTMNTPELLDDYES